MPNWSLLVWPATMINLYLGFNSCIKYMLLMHLVTSLYKTSNQDYSLIIDLRYICDWCCAMLDQKYQSNSEYAAILVIVPETVCWHTPVHTDLEGKITLAVTILVRNWGYEWISGLTQSLEFLTFQTASFFDNLWCFATILSMNIHTSGVFKALEQKNQL